MLYAQSTANGHNYQGETKMYSYHKVKIMIYYLLHIPPLKSGGRNLGEMKMNETGRQVIKAP